MKRALSFVLAAAILLGSAAVASFLISRRPEPARQPAPSRVPFASTAPVVAGDGAIPVHGAGTVRPRAAVDVAAAVTGRVVWVAPNFQSGGRVAEGQLLFRIDDTDYRGRVEQARASVAVQEVELLRVTEEARIARSQYDRFREFRDSGASAADTGPLALWEPQLDAARAVLARDRAALGAAETLLGRTRVHAPFAGVVLEESLDVGQFLAPGQPVGRLYAADAVEVVAPLSDASAALIPGLWRLEAGDAERQVVARVVAEYNAARYAWEGYVDRAEAALDAETRTIDVIVRVPRPFTGGARLTADGGGEAAAGDAPPLLVGKFVEVEIAGVIPQRYFRVRRAALRPDNEIWVAEGGVVRIIPVRVLQRSDDEVFVTGELAEGQAAIIGGIQIATEGMPVRIGDGGPP